MKAPRITALVIAGLLAGLGLARAHAQDLPGLRDSFARPPASARPGVYWYFLDGNSDRAGMTKDLEAMAAAGIGNVLILEVDLGTPAGPVKFMSEQWQANFVHAVREAERLGITISLGTGPGWAGAGGPWVKAEQSMLHLVASTTNVTGPGRFAGKLPVPQPMKPYFNTVSGELQKRREDFYQDVAALAFPTPAKTDRIADADEKALYYRAPFTSKTGVKPYLAEPPGDDSASPSSAIAKDKIIDVTRWLKADGTLDWPVPPGSWTVMRFGARNNGANTRPAPKAGYGFESDKLSSQALDAHLANYTDKLLKKVGSRKPGAGWTMLHLDSWEMGAQNWTPKFRAEFQRRRGYDPLPFFPACTGAIVGTRQLTERFLWDLRLTAQDLVLEQHAGRLKRVAHQAGLALSIEPYDMNPTADLALGAVADQPMGEFWSPNGGFNSAFSCIEAASIAHAIGSPVVGAESFTSAGKEAMTLFPGAMKNQTDWAFAAGINRLVFHTFAHQPLGPEALPGMTFGEYGVHWHRNQTWWPMVPAYHQYIARCSHLLRQGASVADILYLTPEGAPHVFRSPLTAVQAEDPFLPDRKGYNFDGCAPETLLARASVRNGRIAFPNGTAYRVLVLPAFETMTPALLDKIAALVKRGATVVGSPPKRSPSLANYPACDRQVAAKAAALWGSLTPPQEITRRACGKGRIFWGGALHLPSPQPPGELYPPYDAVAAILRGLDVPEDFVSDSKIRYTHRQTADADIYFVANRTGGVVDANCAFRVEGGIPELWDAVSGQSRVLSNFTRDDRLTRVPLRFEAWQSFFVVFSRNPANTSQPKVAQPDFNMLTSRATLTGPWEVAFDPDRGGPECAEFADLQDWTQRSENGIRYYSGIATYRKAFDIAEEVLDSRAALFLDLGTVKDMCRVRLNGHDLGVIWTAPWRVNIGAAAKAKGNQLEIEVANRWANRLIGDQQPADRDLRTLAWPSGLLGGKPLKAGRHTFITHKYYNADSPLLSSGLLGPVTLQTSALRN